MGYYTGRLWIGTPPHEFALIVDTGSTVTYVPCSSCTHCGAHQDPKFKPEGSSSYKPMPCGPRCMSCDTKKQQCKYERRYAEQSTSEGLLGVDLVSFGNSSTLGPERLVFGCETAETGDIYEQRADGIMGLGRGSLSIIDQLVALNVMTASFSLCYGGMDEGGGAMIMGAVPSPSDMVFTHSDFKRSAYYNLGLQAVHVGGTPLPLDRGIFDSSFGTVLDSGTTYAYFPEKAFKAFVVALKGLLKLQQITGPDPSFPDVCFEGAGSDVLQLSQHFPEVQLKFGDGQSVSLAPENYLFKHRKRKGAYCLGIFSNGKNSATLLGGIVVRNMLVTYDCVNQRIGFWRTNCSDLWSTLPAVTSGPSMPAEKSPVTAPTESPVMKPAAEVPSYTVQGTTCVAGTVDVALSLDVNYTTFVYLKPSFLEDLSRDLEVDISQVSLINFTDSGKNVSVMIAVHLAATDERLLNIMAKGIVGHLTNHQVHLRNALGAYKTTGWTVTISNKKSSNSSRFHVLLLLVIAFLVVVFAGAGFLVWWYLRRFRGQKYVSIDRQNVEMSNQLSPDGLLG